MPPPPPSGARSTAWAAGATTRIVPRIKERRIVRFIGAFPFVLTVCHGRLPTGRSEGCAPVSSRLHDGRIGRYTFGPEEATPMEFRILGPLEVEGDSGPIQLRGRKQRALLALLLLRANEVVPAGRLIELLWPETPPSDAAKALQIHISRLRRALGADG